MSLKHLSVRGAALALALVLAAAPSGLLAAPQDYRFELAGTPQLAPGGKSLVSVRLVRTTDNKPITDAVMFEAKADMGPANMAEWLDVEVRRSWAYSDLMPVLPPLGTGLSPVLQWVVIPSAALWMARRASSARQRVRG